MSFLAGAGAIVIGIIILVAVAFIAGLVRKGSKLDLRSNTDSGSRFLRNLLIFFMLIIGAVIGYIMLFFRHFTQVGDHFVNLIIFIPAVAVLLIILYILIREWEGFSAFLLFPPYTLMLLGIILCILAIYNVIATPGHLIRNSGSTPLLTVKQLENDIFFEQPYILISVEEDGTTYTIPVMADRTSNISFRIPGGSQSSSADVYRDEYTFFGYDDRIYYFSFETYLRTSGGETVDFYGEGHARYWNNRLLMLPVRQALPSGWNYYAESARFLMYNMTDKSFGVDDILADLIKSKDIPDYAALLLSSAGTSILPEKQIYTTGESIQVAITGITQQMLDEGVYLALYHERANGFRAVGQRQELSLTGTERIKLDLPQNAGFFEFRLAHSRGTGAGETVLLKAPFIVIEVDGEPGYTVREIEREPSGNPRNFPVSFNNSDEWMQIYYNAVLENSFGQHNHDINSSRYYLFYLDNDNIPELFIDYGGAAAGTALWTIYNDTVVDISLGAGSVLYLERENLVYHSYSRMEDASDTVIKLLDGEFIILHEGSVTSNDNAEPPEDMDYFWDEAKVSEPVYKRLLTDAFDISKASFINIYEDGLTFDEILYLFRSH